VTDDPDTIPFDDLPEKFVVKATHGTSMNVIVDEKSEADFESIRAECER
jgi:hypothetical protein